MTIILPAWLLFLIFIGWACTLMVVWQQLDIRRQPWSNWRRGSIFGIQWGWRWQGRRAIQLTPYCTADETPLVFHYRPELRDVIYVCESCGAEYGPFAGDHRYVLSMIGRQIERRVADGSWRTDIALSGSGDDAAAAAAAAFQLDSQQATAEPAESMTELEASAGSISSSKAAVMDKNGADVPAKVNNKNNSDDDLADLGPVISKR